jgi:hypothetical protein
MDKMIMIIEYVHVYTFQISCVIFAFIKEGRKNRKSHASTHELYNMYVFVFKFVSYISL